MQYVLLTCLVFSFGKPKGHHFEALMLFKTKCLHHKPCRWQVSVLTDSAWHVMLTCQSFSKQSGENKQLRCEDVKQVEYIPQALQLPLPPHSRSNFIKPGGERRDLTLGRVWTTENKVKKWYYPFCHIWKNRGILEVRKRKRRDGRRERRQIHLPCHASTLTSRSSLLDSAMHFAKMKHADFDPVTLLQISNIFCWCSLLFAGLGMWCGRREEEKLLC